jgi:lipid-A-disaccharide synthase
MKYFIIAGEPSGDLHGSNLVRNLFRSDPAAEVSCWGGEMMKDAGALLLKHYRETAFMGAWEVLVNIRKVRANFSDCRRQIAEMGPDVVILIDYPGFNLRIARYVKGLGIKVYYYIAPKIWAWREGRVKLIKEFVDRLYIIFPFEISFFESHGYKAHYLGNPLIDEVEAYRGKKTDQASLMASLGLEDKPVIALLAGSRQQELRHILPVMVSVAASFPDYQFVIAAMEHLPEEIYTDIAGSMPVRIIRNRTYDILSVSEAALVASGTATLEAALFNVPQVVCYRTSAVTYRLAKLVIKVRFISLANLIMDREIVRELVQNDLNQQTLHRELLNIIRSGYRHEIIKGDYARLREVLGGSGASLRIASEIAESLRVQERQ